jgi:hypothetical protein
MPVEPLAGVVLPGVMVVADSDRGRAVEKMEGGAVKD